MPLNKFGFQQPTTPGISQTVFGDPAPQYIAQADIAFPNSNPVMPRALPPQNYQFPAFWYNAMAFPSVNVLYDEKRNGVGF